MIKTVFWDFDGVILDSMKVRDWGFKEIFNDYERPLVDKLLDYHKENGGLSRYVKIRYFFEVLLGTSITEAGVLEYAQKFSFLMKQELTNPKNLILDSVTFIKENYDKFNFHIVSGSDQEELRFICNVLKIKKYFKSIHGSPTPKNQLVKDLLNKYNYSTDETCLIGDSVNDFEAAKSSNISFYSFNSKFLKEKKIGHYINNFSQFNF